MAALTAMLASATLPFGGGDVAIAQEQKKESKRARALQATSNQIAQARSNVQRSLERRRAVARTRAAQAANVAGAGASGITLGSSVVQGSLAGLGSDLATSIAESTGQAASAQQALSFRQEAENRLARSRENSAFAQIGSNAAKQVGSFALGQA